MNYCDEVQKRFVGEYKNVLFVQKYKYAKAVRFEVFQEVDSFEGVYLSPEKARQAAALLVEMAEAIEKETRRLDALYAARSEEYYKGE